MQVGGAGHRADLAIAKGPGHRQARINSRTGVHIAVWHPVEPLAPPQTGEQQPQQRLLVAAGLALQQLPQFLAGGVAIAQLELHLLAHPHPLGHGDGAIAGIDADQVAHQEGRGRFFSHGGQAEVAARHPEKQRGFDQVSIRGTEAAEDLLQRRHWRVAPPIALTHLQQHVALGLLHLQHRANRAAALGHHRFQRPVAVDQAADGAAHHLLVKQQ